MEYMVVAPDGQVYGPADVDSLRLWASEGRLDPTTTLKDFATGRTMPASSVPGIFPEAAAATSSAAPPQVATATPQGQTRTDWSQPPTAYPRAGAAKPYYGQDTGSGDVWSALIRSVLALVFFFFLHGIGLIIAIVGLMASIRAFQKGHKLGVAAVVISVITLIAIGIGWFLRLNGGGPGF